MRGWVVGLVGLAACGGAAPVRPIAVTQTLSIAAGEAPVIAELGDAVYVFDAREVTIYRHGIRLAATPSPAPWKAATTIAAPDGEGRWVVAASASGELWHVTSTDQLEPIRDRFGLGDARVDAVAGAGRSTAIATATTIAVSTDGLHLRTFAQTGLAAIARDRIARITPTGVERWDLGRGSRVDYPITAPRTVAFVDADTERPRLVVATDHAIYVERAGDLARVPSRSTIRDLAVSRGRIWVLADRALWLVEGDALVPTTVTLAGPATLRGSITGEVWVDRGALERYALASDAIDPAWHATVAPVVQRICAHCHLPGGSADLDLSTPSAWRAHRGEIVDRVLVERTMPPAGTAISDPDRRALEAWLRP